MVIRDYGKDCLTQPPTVTGNLLWLCQLYHQHYLYSMNTSLIAPLYRLLRPAIMFYTHFQYDQGGRIHLPPTYSPEYPGPRGADTNYDLSLYRWGLTTIIGIAQQYYPNDTGLPLWRDTLKRLTDYPVDTNGYMIAATVPFATSHRHFSHLMHIFPLATINFTSPSERRLAETSVDHWIGMVCQSFPAPLPTQIFAFTNTISFIVTCMGVCVRRPVSSQDFVVQQ
jgi:alpha-L-fucosidase 2